MRNKIAIFMIILGVLVAAYPLANKLYIYYWESRLLSEFESQIDLGIEADSSAESEFYALQDIFEEENEAANELELLTQGTTEPTTEEYTAPTLSNSPTEAPEETTEAKAPSSPAGVIGKIVIPKIELSMPILQGASDYNLNRGAATIDGTSGIGEVGNVGIAGHRGRSFGIMFNRLDEMEVGDLIEIQTSSQTFKYRVYKTLLVEPTDVSVLYRSDKYKVLTLVTCDPVRNPTHRLIVHAVLEP
jgi:sortase A